MPVITQEQGASKQMQAFIDTVAKSEGTSTVQGSDDGYNVMVGGTIFTGYADHPRQRVFIPRLAIFSTAAGRYQVLARYFDWYKKLLGLDDFSPLSQDLIAIQQIRERHAIPAIEAGDLAKAVALCAAIWASLPGANYPGQHMQKMAYLTDAFTAAGGQLA